MPRKSKKVCDKESNIGEDQSKDLPSVTPLNETNLVENSNSNTVDVESIVTVKRRGRKPKKLQVESSEKNTNAVDTSIIETDNIIVTIEEEVNKCDNTKVCNEIVKQDILVNSLIDATEVLNVENKIVNNDVDVEDISDSMLISKDSQNKEDDKCVVKKRGRKPKGGKIIQQIVPLNISKDPKPNVILHLKCGLKDLNNNTLESSCIDSYNFSNTGNLTYEIIGNNTDINNYKPRATSSFIIDTKLNDEDSDNEAKKTKESDIKEVWKKLKNLEHNLHINNTRDKKSACFWCTYDFDNPPIYIPKHYIKESYHVYGCFCSPECATAYLMEENIDSSAKFERYHLINHIYSKIYNYTKNIKPAPNPYYMLEKYYGNLSIQEYRSLLKTERLFLVVDKPLTRILPELHEDNDDFIINNKIIPSNTFQIKKNLQKTSKSKSNILSERFGLAQ